MMIAVGRCGMSDGAPKSVADVRALDALHLSRARPRVLNAQLAALHGGRRPGLGMGVGVGVRHEVWARARGRG